jgi:hypothetical protein
VRHLQGRGRKILAIQVSNYVKKRHIRQKTQSNPTTGVPGNITGDESWGRQVYFSKIGLVGLKQDYLFTHTCNACRQALFSDLVQGIEAIVETISLSHFIPPNVLAWM